MNTTKIKSFAPTLAIIILSGLLILVGLMWSGAAQNVSALQDENAALQAKIVKGHEREDIMQRDVKDLGDAVSRLDVENQRLQDEVDSLEQALLAQTNLDMSVGVDINELLESLGLPQTEG